MATVAALLVWQIAALCLNQPMFLPSPWAVLLRLGGLCLEEGFWGAVWASFSNIVGGFFLAFLIGAVLAVLAGRFQAVEILLWPYMVTVKSVPVASFIILAYVWFSSAELSVFISFLMVLPVVYTNLLSGVHALDRKLGEMADVFHMPLHRRLGYVWLPQMKPFLFSACSLSLGLAWKAGIAAEVIGAPEGFIGEEMYLSKVYFATTDLLAWTVVVILLSVGFEKLVMGGLKLGFSLWEKRGSKEVRG